MNQACAVCGAQANIWAAVDGYPYTDCETCGSIALDAIWMAKIDAGVSLRQYDDDYWRSELASAHERCWGSSVARALEAILLCRRPVFRFVDLGCGSGELLDALSHYLPSSADLFFGVEKYPPATHTLHRGFIHSDIAEVSEKFDCGVCVEVIEHLTPAMLDAMLAGLARASRVDAFYIFNTGLSDFVRAEDPGYIDPVRRGHIVSWGWPAIRERFAAHGFEIRRLGQRDWAFGAEYRPSSAMPIGERTWHPLPRNLAILSDPQTGTVPAILARESMRAYG